MMKPNFRRSTLVLCSLLVACASAHDQPTATGATETNPPAGTETDNPVVATNSPADFTPPVMTSPCAPPQPDTGPTFPYALPRSTLIATARGNVLAVADGGLTLLDASDPAHLLTLSAGSVRGTVSELLVSASGQLWVVASEAPEVDGSKVPGAEELAAHSRLIVFDVNDPTAPVRLAQAEFASGWLHERGDQIWALSARPVAEALRCDAPRSSCGGAPSYEAVTLSAFRPSGGTLESVAEAELPFDRRIWWNGDGLVTALEDESLHVLSWDESGALRTPRVLTLPETGASSGPVQVAGNELSVVSVAAGHAALHVYDLTSSSTSPARSFALGDAISNYPYQSPFSLFSRGYLWLQRFEPETAAAELWDVSGPAPVKVALPEFATVLPLEGVTREGGGDEVLAFGVTPGVVESLLSLQGTQVSVLGPAPAGTADIPYSNVGNPIPAPANLHGSGNAPLWNLYVRGPGLPIGMDPAPPAPSGRTEVKSTVAIQRPGAEPAQASLVQDYVYDTTQGTMQPNPRLQVTSDGATTNLELSPSASSLLPMDQGVLAIDGYEVQVFDLSGTPQLRATLAFPELSLPVPANPNQLTVRWEDYDGFSGLRSTRLKLDDRHVAFVAHVALSCFTQEDCDAMGLEAIPIRQSNYAGSSYIACPPGSDASCMPQLVTLSVAGSGQRQYLYVLDLGAEGGPAWESWGTSSLEATAARSDANAHFSGVLATQGTLASTRLERSDASGPLPPGSFRFMLDRFERSASNDVFALPPVNVPGYPVAKLGGPPSSERWISMEPPQGDNAPARLYRLDIRSDGAHVEQTLDLDAGTLSTLQAIQIGDRWLGLVLSSPENACGSTQLSALELGSAAGDSNEPLGIASTLELPADRWALVAVDQNRALLRHDQVYTLVELAADGSLSVVSTRSSDVWLDNDSLAGKTLFGASRSGTRRIDF